jgi:type II secretory pathway pseudopilin PulG
MDDQPSVVPAVPAVQNCGLATASLVLGIVALIPCLGFPFAIGALICGIMAYSKIKAAGGLMLGKGKATAGIVMACVSIVILPIVGIMAGMLLPALSTAREKARMANCVANMKGISTSITLFADDHEGQMPVTLQELANGTYAPVGSMMFVCPKSQRPYIYPGTGQPWQKTAEDISVYCDENHLNRHVIMYNDGRVSSEAGMDFLDAE